MIKNKSIYTQIIIVLVSGFLLFSIWRQQQLPDSLPKAGSSATTTFTLDEVSLHDSKSDCYTDINGSVYDVTAYFGKHPGGDSNLFSVCGIDATAAFSRQHGRQWRPKNVLAGFEVGIIPN